MPVGGRSIHIFFRQSGQSGAPHWFDFEIMKHEIRNDNYTNGGLSASREEKNM